MRFYGLRHITMIVSERQEDVMERDLASVSWSLEGYFMQGHTQDELRRLRYITHVSSGTYLVRYLMEQTGETCVPLVGNISLLHGLF